MTEPISLADRRRAALERIRAAELARTIAELEQVVADHRGEQIAKSKRKHPSNPKPYDHQSE